MVHAAIVASAPYIWVSRVSEVRPAGSISRVCGIVANQKQLTCSYSLHYKFHAKT